MPMVLCEPYAEASKRKVVLSTGGSFAASYTSPLYPRLQIRFGSGFMEHPDPDLFWTPPSGSFGSGFSLNPESH